MSARAIISERQSRCRWVKTRFEGNTVSIHIKNRLRRHARIHCGLRNGGGDHFHQAGIKRRGDDIINAEACRHSAVGCRDFFGHLFAGKLSNGIGRRNLHFFIDRRRAHIKRTAENEGKAKDIIDLIGIIRTPRRDNCIGTNGLCVRRGNFWIGIGHRKDDRRLRHIFHHLRLERARCRKAQEDIRANQRFGQCAGFGHRGMSRFPLIHPVRSALVDHALAVTHDHIGGRNTHCLNKRGARNCSGSRAVDDNFNLGEFAPRNVARIDDAGRRNDSGAVLIIVHHRNIHLFAQGLFDDEAFGGFDIFKVDPAKAWLHQRDRIDEGFGVFGREFDVYRINIGKAFEQTGLAFHHGF